ncbi:MAG: hypothetical protein CSA66_08090 [Proteobacteria bacterium]|nr:MAG: hypothetical protein CSA66_08090 [Pseudomonadota bacterium]
MKSNMRICPQCGTETTALTCRHDGFGTVDSARYRPNDPAGLIGTLFQDRYRIDAVLGSGGVASVYQATQVRVGRRVALKVINIELASDLDVVARFQRQGRAIASLIHPNIVQVFDFGQTEDGQLYMAMELVDGKSLADLIRDQAPLNASRVLHIGAQLFDALAQAHEHGVIHRNLKPDNILVTESGRHRDVVKIVDFGVATIVSEPTSESLVTARGAILGSPKYMAPEQARGKGVTGHADLYAVGGILYELLSGRAVFDEPCPADYLVAHAVKMPTPPAIDGRELLGPLVDVILECLDKKPWNRPDGAARALEALEACRLTPLLEAGEAPPVQVDVPEGQDASPRRLVTTTPPRPVDDGHEVDAAPPLLALGDENDDDDDDMRPRVVAAGIVRKSPTPEPRAAAQSRETEVGPVGVAATRGEHRGALTTVARASSPEQDHPTAAGPAIAATAAPQGIAGRREERRRGGAGLLLLAAALLLFAGGPVFLADNSFLRGDRHRSAARTAQVAAPVVDPVPSGIGPGGEAGLALAALDHGESTPSQGELGADPRAASSERAANAGGDDKARAHDDAAAERARARGARGAREEADRRAREESNRPVPELNDPLAYIEDPQFPDKADDGGALRRVLVDSTPSGATVRMGSLTLGRTPLYVEWRDFGRPVTVTLTKVGFRTPVVGSGRHPGQPRGGPARGRLDPIAYEGWSAALDRGRRGAVAPRGGARRGRMGSRAGRRRATSPPQNAGAIPTTAEAVSPPLTQDRAADRVRASWRPSTPAPAGWSGL